MSTTTTESTDAPVTPSNAASAGETASTASEPSESSAALSEGANAPTGADAPTSADDALTDAEGIVTDSDGDEGTEIDPKLKKARKEAASYRERLRTAEADRDTATEQVAALQWQLVANALKFTTVDGLKALDVDVSTLFDADGQLDARAVASADSDASSKFRQPASSTDAGIGRQGGTPATGWAALLK